MKNEAETACFSLENDVFNLDEDFKVKLNKQVST